MTHSSSSTGIHETTAGKPPFRLFGWVKLTCGIEFTSFWFPENIPVMRSLITAEISQSLRNTEFLLKGMYVGYVRTPLS